MNHIETKAHIYFNYQVAILMIASASLVIFATGWGEIWLPLVFASLATVYASKALYTSQMQQKKPQRRQLLNNIMEGVLVTISTWLFGFANYLLTPHTLLNLFKIEWNDFFGRT